MIQADLRQALESRLAVTIESVRRVSGGDINDAFSVVSTSGDTYFVKGNTIPSARDMFAAETYGLRLIGDTGFIPVPEIIDAGQIEGYSFLVMEYLETSDPDRHAWETFSVNLGKMHKQGKRPFGLDKDNFIGRLPQYNDQGRSWPDFYREQRIVPQLEIMKKTFPGEVQIFRDAEVLLGKLDDILEDAEPSLIHGDLWGGNFLASTDGDIYLIDPAVAIASREMDIAMSLLFGGYPETFYEAYDAHFPLPSGWRDRVPIYQLYYLLVHVNLFGRSYFGSAHQAIMKYL